MLGYQWEEKYSVGVQSIDNQHKEIIEKVVAIKADAKSGKLVSSIELINFLKNWIDHHILEVDMKYRECFHKNGLR